jgi:hypothetical protein
MPDLHTIHLRQPWTCEAVDGRTVWMRSFNWPAGLTAREAVWLVIEGLPATASVDLNRQELDSETTGRFNITQRIAEHNWIAIKLPDASATDGAFPFNVRLEIDEG